MQKKKSLYENKNFFPWCTMCRNFPQQQLNVVIEGINIYVYSVGDCEKIKYEK